MGWCGYTIYSGDGTQTWHYDFLKWSKVSNDDDEIWNWLTFKKTKIPKDKIDIFIKNIGKILKKMPKSKYWNEDNSIEWQMLLALFVDNKLPVPRLILEKGIDATEYLMGEHASEFDKPSNRKYHLKKFIEKSKKLKLL